MWQLTFCFPLMIIFFFLSLFAGIFDQSILLQSSVIIFFSFLLLPTYYDQLPRKWSAARKVRTHIVFSIFMILLLHVGYFFRMGVLKENSFDYRFAHLSGPFQTIYSFPPFQFVIGNIYRVVPLDRRISFYQAEDGARVSRIHQDVDSDFARSLLCYDKDRAACFLNVMKASVNSHSTGTSGTYAIYDKGAKMLRDEEEIFPEEHQLHMKLSADLLQLVTTLSTREETIINHYVPGFPEETSSPDLLKLVKKDKKARFLLAHQPAVIHRKNGRSIAGKFELFPEREMNRLKKDITY